MELVDGKVLHRKDRPDLFAVLVLVVDLPSPMSRAGDLNKSLVELLGDLKTENSAHEYAHKWTFFFFFFFFFFGQGV